MPHRTVGAEATSGQDAAVTPSAPRLRDYRLDVLRGIAIVLVFLRHLGPLREFWQLPVKLPAYVFNEEVAITSVVVLLIVSLYLFAQRVDRGRGYLVTRVKRLLLLLVIYSALQVSLFLVATRTAPPLGLRELWLAGPTLPIVGDSVFYFLVVLIFLTVLGWYYFRLPTKYRDPLGLAVFVISIAAFELLAFAPFRVGYYVPLNFIVCLPITDCLLRHKEWLSRKLWGIVALYALFVAHDLLLQGPLTVALDVGRGQVFARPSVVFGALALVVAFQRFNVPRQSALELAGKYSLGLFAFHKWVMYAMALLAAPLATIDHVHYFEPIVVTFATAILTCLLVALLSRTRLRVIVTSG